MVLPALAVCCVTETAARCESVATRAHATHPIDPADGVLCISLRSSATVAPGAPITLADIATLYGDERLAESVGRVVIVTPEDALRRSGSDARLSLEIEVVRSTVLQSVSPAQGSRLAFRGSRCGVRIGTATLDPAETLTAPRPERRSEFQTPEPWGTGTLRGLIAERLAGHLGVRVTDLRLSLSVAGGGDAVMLDSPVTDRQRVEVHPSASSTSASVPMRVDVFERDRLVRTLHVGARVLVRRTVMITRSVIDREMPVMPDHVMLEERWVTPPEVAGLDVASLEGLVTRRRIEAGRVLSMADLQAPLAADRGQPVWVHYLGRGISIKVRARALAPAREGELARLQIDGSRHVIEARMSGRGTAVMLADPAEGAPPPEHDQPIPQSTMSRPPQVHAPSSSGSVGGGEPATLTRTAGHISQSETTPAPPSVADDGMTVHQRARLWRPTSVADRQSSNARPR
jgi:flagella basal body P-ring formation protein FlgA